MFHFRIKPILKNKSGKCPQIKIDEFQLATMIRIFKSRNRELYSKFERFYDDVIETVERQ